TWSEDDAILISQGRNGILRVSANGGKPETLVTVQPNEGAFTPQLLPGGEFLLFTITNQEINVLDRWDKAQVVVQSLKSGERKVLIEGGTDAQYVPTGHLVYTRGPTLFAVPFDVKALRTTGSAVPIIEGVMRGTNNNNTGVGQFSVSKNGSLI